MELEEAIKGLEGMIKCGGIWEGGFKDDEKEILERILHYIKEESIPKAKVEEKVEVIQERFKEETRIDFLITLKILENELQEILNKGEKDG